MNESQPQQPSRRQVLKTTGQIAAAGALAAAIVPNVHAAGNDLIQVALVGCGGRGTGAAMNAISTKPGPIKVVAMADAYEGRLKGSYGNLSKQGKEKVDVPAERQFAGYDSYKAALDCLKPGDVAIFATPCAFRWVHFQYAIAKGLNVFMEKPVTADGPTSRRMLALGEEATAKGLKVGVGLMSRHAKHIQELKKHIEAGEIGDIISMRGYRMQGLLGHSSSLPKPANISDLDYQIQRFHSFLWSGGGAFSDFNIHIIDHLSWLKGSWPVKAMGIGGRHFKTAGEKPYVDQNFDSYSIEYTYNDGTKLFMDGRTMTNAHNIYCSFIHGSKGLAVAARSGDCGGPSITYKGQMESKENKIWESQDNTNPYQNEWDTLIECIRENKPHNEVKHGVEASLVTSMGRRSAHTAQEITFDEMLNDEWEYAPGIDKLTKESPAPVLPDSNGMYPQPQPGTKKKREY